MAEQAEWLVEIGTEELPPKSLKALRDAFGAALADGLKEAGLAHAGLHAYASPRRLAVRVSELARVQPPRTVSRRGPPVQVAVGPDGAPTRAGQKFAAGCGVPFEQLGRLQTDKGDYLLYENVEPGEPAEALLPRLVESALATLPVPRRMRWGSSDAEFVRPVHWLVMLLDDAVIPATLFDIDAGRETRGHRFLAPEPITIANAGDYPGVLEHAGYVLADFGRRRSLIETSVSKLAAEIGGRPLYDDDLLDEVTALVEWPVPVAGRFEERFLALPREVLVSTLQAHQRYFPVENPAGELLPRFITVSNLPSRDPAQVSAGNERVVRPRLSDAAFFYDSDRRRPLASRFDALDGVVFQKKLGSLKDKSLRVASLAGDIAGALGVDPESAMRAARLAKCDLLTEMVGEFPDLQGVMGRYYAVHDGEPAAVADAIGDQYLPRYAGDALPAGDVGQVLALADKLDTLTGIFGIGQRPSGTRDPFGLRRGALGALRIMIEHGLDLDLLGHLNQAASRIPGVDDPARVADEVFDYMMERLRSYYVEAERDPVPGEVFEAVLAKRPTAPLDFHQRIEAVRSFAALPAADSLAAANKRVANILRKAGYDGSGAADPARLVEPEERRLYEDLDRLRDEVERLIDSREYRAGLERLATLREPVDAFFDKVMVMAEEPELQRNRLALLSQMHELFLRTADLSRLSV
jgi:glycyl-tRNA synthetase beta chain